MEFRFTIYVILILVSFCGIVTSQDDRKGYFWQLNDLHYDPTYWTSQKSCNEEVTDPGKYGDYRCDSPWELIESSVKALQTNGREAAFIMWSGDLPPHFKDEGDMSEKLLLEITRNVTNLINTTFPDVPILPVIGNHDYYPIYNLPGERTSLYETLGDLWAPWFNDTEITNKFKFGGFYSKIVSTNPLIRAVVPNTNLYNIDNPLTEGSEDPGGQFQWLDELLMGAPLRGEKVYMLIHIPPGMAENMHGYNFFYEAHNERFLEILQKHAEVILGTFAGHVHTDSFKMVYKDGIPSGTVFVAPSVTPWKIRLPHDTIGKKHNPGVRKVLFYQSNYTLDDVEQYYLDLPRANRLNRDNWIRLYSFKNMYKVNDVTPSSIQAVLDDFKVFGTDHFHDYYDLNAVKLEEALPPCGCTCKSNHICSMEFIDRAGYDECVDDPGYACTGSHVLVSVAVIVMGVILSI